MKNPGITFILNGGAQVYDKRGNTIRTIPASPKKAYRLLLQRQYHPLAEQQEWLKRQIDAEC